jgi:hypothetical protein
MEYDFIMSIGNSIDCVYNNITEDGSRKTVAKIEDENTMSISFRTILNAARESDLHMQLALLEKESSEVISSRLKLIKKEFKNSSGRELSAKKINSKDNLETLTVSPYSPHRKLKYTCTCFFEVK